MAFDFLLLRRSLTAAGQACDGGLIDAEWEITNESAEEAYVPVYGPGYGRWRLEVEPAVPNKTDYFLSILKPSLGPEEGLRPIGKLETATTFGAEITKDGQKYVVSFSKDSLEAPGLEIREAR